MDKKHRREIMHALSLISQMGITIAACVMIGIFLGKFLDKLLGTAPFLLLLFSFIGVAAALRTIFTLIMRK